MATKKQHTKATARLGRFHPSVLILPLCVMIIAGLVSYDVERASLERATTSFDDRARSAGREVSTKLNNYTDLLYVGAAFKNGSDAVTQAEWRQFFQTMGTFERYPGVSSVMYVDVVPDDQLASFAARMQSSEYFGPSYQLKVEKNGQPHALISSYLSERDMSRTIGMDMLRTPDRRQVYEAAAAHNAPTASASMKLVTGYQGFFVLLPRIIGGQTTGYALVSFRYDDLFAALLRSNEDADLGYRFTDVTAGSKTTLYTSHDWNDHADMIVSQNISIAGRTWRIDTANTRARDPRAHLVPVIVMMAGAVMAVAMTKLVRVHRRRD